MPEYVNVPIETDPDAIAEIAFDYMEEKIANWTPADGNLDVWMLMAIARMAAEVRDVASDVPIAIFRYFGSAIMGVNPIDAIEATALTTWTAVDNVGYTVDEGTIIGMRDGDGELVGFEVITPFTIPALSTVAVDIEVKALEPGVFANALTNPVEEITPLDFIAGITSQAASSGGEDDETDENYLSRLIIESRLRAPRPIIPTNFAEMAMSITGITRAVAFDLFQAALNEKAQLSHTATGGTFTLTVGANTTAGITALSTAAQIKTAVELLASVGANNTLVTGGPLPALVNIEFINGKAGTNLTVTGNGASLTGGGGAASFSLINVQDGAAGVPNTARTVTVAVVGEAGAPVTTAIKDQLLDLLQTRRELNFVISIIDPTYTTIDVTYAATAEPGHVLADVKANADAALIAYLNPGNWGIPSSGDVEGWHNKTLVEKYELGTVLNNVPGLDRVTALTFRTGANPFLDTAVTLTGVAPLPNAGVITGAVV